MFLNYVCFVSHFLCPYIVHAAVGDLAWYSVETCVFFCAERSVFFLIKLTSAFDLPKQNVFDLSKQNGNFMLISTTYNC